MLKSGFKVAMIFSLLTLIMISCSNPSSVDENAKLMTLSQVETTPGFDWFVPWYSDYKPDATVISDIRNTFDTTSDKIVIYSKPSCSCEETQKIFPETIKVLTEAGIGEANYEIYSMASINGSHPYETILTINSIPAIFIFRNGSPVYSVIDTINVKKGRNPGVDIVLEKEILEGLQN